MRSAFLIGTWLAVALWGAALSFVPACKLLHGSAAAGGVDALVFASPAVDAGDAAGPSSSAGASDAAAAAPTHALVRPSGPPAAGNACAPRDAKEASACAPGGFEELACVGEVWKVAETCRGPGGCKSDATGVQCDPGTPRPGDACLATAAPRCSNVHTVFACKNGAWE